jgi:exopolyphosphatase / guanosine-5'-triphosphate,3'-diphosphate pyrophosphatase
MATLKTIAALDVGSNTVLMVVAQRRPDGTVTTLDEMARITRLGRGVDRNGRLDPDSARATLDAIIEFAGRARVLGAEKICAAATAALRDAADGADFIDEVRRCTGISLEIISGETEARMSWLAAVRGLGLDPAARLLIVDIGGGSTEFIRAEPDLPLDAVSLQIGSVRLTERHYHHDPPTPADIVALRATIDTAIDALGWDYSPDVAVGIAGTVTTVCATSLGLERYDHAVVHGHRLARADIIRVLDLFGSMPTAERRLLPGVAEGRADVIYAGATILERIVERFGLAEVIVSDQGVRWGLIWRELDQVAT